ncbi:MAG: UDP-N-acetylmuramoyl-tripeptide--D-alanyl-D-alanine ligase [Vallitaleaceae bacterium]|nr:UDP-N-acetylmuramoyl-tripeptide--D-alanyl-D-alanine ligase [Vallitaleaceae bacterium]
MDLIVLYVAVLTGLLYAGIRTLYHLHMFQLNSYRIERYGQFIKSNLHRLFSLGSVFFGVIVVVIGFMYSHTIVFHENYVLLFYTVIFLIRLRPLLFHKERVKKPLAYTMRVKRILATIALLYLCAVLIFVFWIESLMLMTMMFLITPVVLLLANTILIPFEKYLRYYYYNDAKKILNAHKDLKIIGITGSYGKTSTKFFLEKILSQQFNTLMTPHSYNTTLGVVRTVRESLNRSHEVFIAEMGAKQKGDIKEICDLVQPQIGMVTAVGPQHLETFGSLSNVIDTKFELIQAIRNRGKGFVNGDSCNVEEGMKRNPSVTYITYGTKEQNIVRIKSMVQTPQGTDFIVETPAGEQAYHTRLLGAHNILNIAGAIAIAMELGMSYEKISTGVKEIRPVEHRLELKKQGDYFILDDAFNANPTGAKSALDVLAQFTSGQKIIMTPGMIELGNLDHEMHYEFGKQIAQVCDRVVLIGKLKTKSIYLGLEESGYDLSKVSICNNVYEGFAKIREIVTKGDIVLIENDLPDNFNE